MIRQSAAPPSNELDDSEDTDCETNHDEESEGMRERTRVEDGVRDEADHRHREPDADDQERARPHEWTRVTITAATMADSAIANVVQTIGRNRFENSAPKIVLRQLRQLVLADDEKMDMCART